MARTTSAIKYLTGKRPPAPQGVNVVFGGDSYLKKMVLARLTHLILPGDDAEFSLTRIDVEKETWADVLDTLSTQSLFGDGKRLVILEDADDFVKQNRNSL